MVSINEIDPSIQKWLKYVLVLLLCRVQRPFSWASFLSLNSTIRKGLRKSYERIEAKSKFNLKDSIPTFSNAITCAFLYRASVDNPLIGKDYMLIYLFQKYIGMNPPSSDIYVSRFSKYTKLSHYNSPTLKYLYDNKEFIIFPAIFGQILSNYLTPTRLGLNRKYQSQFIRSRILDPIWINFSLGVRSNYINWAGLLLKYLTHNLILAAFFLLTTFKSKFVDLYYQVKYNKSNELIPHIIKKYMLHAVHTANSWANFVYLPNLLSMLLIALTAPMMRPSTKLKFLLKTYMKTIGFVSGFITLVANSMDFVPDWGMENSGQNIRRLSKSSVNAINDYLFRILILSKWRIVKENHRLFRGISWSRIETALMSVAVFKFMSLTESTTIDAIKRDSIVRGVDYIMR